MVRGDFVNEEHQNDWRPSYQAALLELDPVKLPQRIEQAYRAIQTCLHAQQNGNCAEYQALADALANLRVLRREILPSASDAPDQPASIHPTPP